MASVAPGDVIGQSGLQARYEEQLGGTAGSAVIIREADGTPADTLLAVDAKPGRPLRTTLDIDVQRAAEDALADRDDEAALVAVEPASGDILAVANRPTDDGYNRALEGRYPPGSTFKVVSTTALLRAGLDPERDRRLPADVQRRRPRLQELRGQRGRRRAVLGRLRAVVQHRLRLAHRAPRR